MADNLNRQLSMKITKDSDDFIKKSCEEFPVSMRGEIARLFFEAGLRVWADIKEPFSSYDDPYQFLFKEMRKLKLSNVKGGTE